MPHPHISPATLTSEGRLLNETQLRYLSMIESFVESIQSEVQALLLAKEHYESQQKELEDCKAVAANPVDYLDQVIMPLADESLTSYRQRIFSTLDALLLTLKSDDAKHMIETTKTKFLTCSSNELSSYKKQLSIMLNTIRETYEEPIEDYILEEELEPQTIKLMDEADLLDTQQQALEEKIRLFKSREKLHFELDEHYHLKKISKNNHTIPYSIIYITAPHESHPRAIALYRGKEHALGKGMFGDVKLGQDIQTGRWLAIKIQQKIMKQLAGLEKAALTHLNRFEGESTRDSKYYIAEELLTGIDLEKHILQHHDPLFQNRLEIAIKATQLLQQFHKHFLHRDIKPANFIWDETSHTLQLCDFGLSVMLPEGHDGIEDFSGTGTYLAPEIDEKHTHTKVLYSKKSESYALGEMFRVLFADLNDDVPDEIHDLIAHMIESDTDKRLGHLEEIEDTLIRLQSTRTNSPSGS